jgi:hypothetical protein
MMRALAPTDKESFARWIDERLAPLETLLQVRSTRLLTSA